jgi:hypothetical protein
MVFERWQDVIAMGKCADAVLIGLQVRAYSRRGSLTVALTVAGLSARRSSNCILSTRISHHVREANGDIGRGLR